MCLFTGQSFQLFCIFEMLYNKIWGRKLQEKTNTAGCYALKLFLGIYIWNEFMNWQGHTSHFMFYIAYLGIFKLSIHISINHEFYFIMWCKKKKKHMYILLLRCTYGRSHTNIIFSNEIFRGVWNCLTFS